MRRSTLRHGALALALHTLLLAGPALAAPPPAVVELDGLRVLRTRAAVPYQLGVRILHTGPAEEVLKVRTVRVLDRSRRTVQQAKVERTAASLGDIWERLEPLRRMEHDEVFLYEAPETALPMFERLEQGAVDLRMALPLATLNPGWSAGSRIDLQVVVELDSSLQGGFTLELPFDIEVLQPFFDPRLPAGAPAGRFFRGDTHVHSAYTHCDGYFKAKYPIRLGGFNPEAENDSLQSLYRAAGLQWIALADHCYCVNLQNYQGLSLDAAYASDGELLVIPGLEMSARERQDDGASCTDDNHNTAHFNGIGLKVESALFPYRKDFPESGQYACDADRPIFRADAPSVQDALTRLRNPNLGITGAVSLNHAGGTGVGEVWNMDAESFECAEQPPETGMELINELWDDNQDERSIQLWVHQRLLKGHHVAAYAGSDMHTRQEVIGATFTGVFASGLARFGGRTVEQGLAAGHTFASSGPHLLALFGGPAGQPVSAMMGETLVAVAGAPLQLQLSYDGGGKPLRICLFQGTVGASIEAPLAIDGANSGNCMNASGNGILAARLAAPDRETYVRAVAVAQADADWRAYSSPLWLRPAN